MTVIQGQARLVLHLAAIRHYANLHDIDAAGLLRHPSPRGVRRILREAGLRAAAHVPPVTSYVSSLWRAVRDEHYATANHAAIGLAVRNAIGEIVIKRRTHPAGLHPTEHGPAALRIAYAGPNARRYLAAAPTHCTVRCVACSSIATECACRMIDGTWMVNRESGRSFLSERGYRLEMQGKARGPAVGVEIELRTVPRDHGKLTALCVGDQITTKGDGTVGVSVELCTQPMLPDVAGDVLRRLWTELEGAEVAASGVCGVHVHVDATGLDRDGLIRLLKLWRSYGARVWQALPVERRSCRYARPTWNQPIDYEGVVYFGTRIEIPGRSTARYVDLNLCNLVGDRRTVEFRLFPAYAPVASGVLNQGDVPISSFACIDAAVKLSRAFVTCARRPAGDRCRADAGLLTAVKQFESAWADAHAAAGVLTTAQGGA